MLDAGLGLRREKGGIRFSSCPPETSSPMQEISLKNKQPTSDMENAVWGADCSRATWGETPFPEYYLDLKIAGKFVDIQRSMGIIWNVL